MFNEIMGVQHIKVAVFDNHVLLTGANLQEEYFTDRQDRYMVFKHCGELADYYDDLINIIIDSSPQIDDFGSITAPVNLSYLNHSRGTAKQKTLMRNRLNMHKFMHDPKLDNFE
ncbi:MAG: hypothetical protein V2I33_22550 [Kangiellaceae bacterium]|nr:hypothetical protein [Kangiellaceae bacterium]